jgi:hypothetical protein
MGEIFAFFLHLIFEHTHALKEAREHGQEAELNMHVRVVQVVLLTLTGFIDWVSINHIMASDGQLLQILCLLLDDENFQAAAAECLLQVVTYPFSGIFGKSIVTLPFLHLMASYHHLLREPKSFLLVITKYMQGLTSRTDGSLQIVCC